MVILTLLILRLKYCNKLLQYLCLPPWANVIKLFIWVIYCHFMVFTAMIMFHNTGWQQYHGTAVNTTVKSFVTLAPGRQWQRKNNEFHDFSSRVPELSEEKFQKMKDFAGLLFKPCIHQGILTEGEGMLPTCPNQFSLAAFHWENFLHLFVPKQPSYRGVTNTSLSFIGTKQKGKTDDKLG